MMQAEFLRRGASLRLIKPATSSTVRIRPIALPVEHGGWGLLFEPLALGLLLAPSAAGFFISIAALGAFLARHPFKLAVLAWRRGQKSDRLLLAGGFALMYGGLAVIGLGAALSKADSFLLPLLLAAPLAMIQLCYDALGRSRELLPELLGSIAIAATSAAIVLAGGWSHLAAFGLWAVVVARVVPTIMYVRARLSQQRRKSAPVRLVILLHVIALALIAGLASIKVVPFAIVIAAVVLLSRAVVGFSRSNRIVKAKHLGLLELLFGAVTVLVTVIGYKLAW